MKVVLTIAGSDSSGGAGIQADLKTFEAFGVFGTSVITVLTAQNTKGVTDIYPVDTKFIEAQLKAVFDDFEVAAIKIGMLFSNEVIETVKNFIKDLNIPIVFDPVCVSKAGSKLLNDDAIENLKSILPYCAIATPNMYEAKELFDYEPNTDTNFISPVLVKNYVENNCSLDVLFYNNTKHKFQTEYIDTRNTHGTGCSFSSAIAANLALGKNLKDAIFISKNFIFESIKQAPNLGHGKGPIAHKAGGVSCQ